MAALRWLAQGYGYEVTGHDVLSAYSFTIKAAENAGCAGQVQAQIRALITSESDAFVSEILGRQLGIPG